VAPHGSHSPHKRSTAVVQSSHCGVCAVCGTGGAVLRGGYSDVFEIELGRTVNITVGGVGGIPQQKEEVE
jgi:hypothetical protein